MNINITVEDVDELWTVQIKNGKARVTRFLNGKQVAGTVSGKKLGEMLMYMRAPLQETSSRSAMAKFDELPEWLKPLYTAHGVRPVRMWEDGYTRQEIVLVCDERVARS